MGYYIWYPICVIARLQPDEWYVDCLVQYQSVNRNHEENIYSCITRMVMQSNHAQSSFFATSVICPCLNDQYWEVSIPEQREIERIHIWPGTFPLMTTADRPLWSVTWTWPYWRDLINMICNLQVVYCFNSSSCPSIYRPSYVQ